MSEYISIKDFAIRAGVSQQSIYARLKQVDNELNKYVEEVDNLKMLDIRALQEVYNIGVEQEVEQLAFKMLSTELNAKNAQIEQLQQQLIECDQKHREELARVHNLLENEQKLHLYTQQRLIALNDQLEQSEPKDVKHWWQFWK